MAVKDLYVHYDTVTNHVLTRGIDLIMTDFPDDFFPSNMILSEEPIDFGRYDAKTNFKVVRNRPEVAHYMRTVEQEKLRISNWIDFESVEMMHLLEPSEIAEILYLFHTAKTIRSAFFYKLQNNYVYLTLPNGLNKTYYRYIAHFYPRFSRLITQAMREIINDGKPFFSKKVDVQPMPAELTELLLDYFEDGLKINVSQSYTADDQYYIPLNIIEDDLAKLTHSQRPKEHIALITYNTQTGDWQIKSNQA